MTSRKPLKHVVVPLSMKKFDPDPFNRKYIEKCIRLAAEEGIPVILYTPALNRDRSKAWRRFGVTDHCLEFMAAMKNRNENVRAVVNLFDLLLPDTEMVDNYHPGRKGAERFTRALTKALRPYLKE